MKIIKKISTYLLLISTLPIHGMFNEYQPLQGKTFFSPRSQNANMARDMVGWQSFLNECCTNAWYGALAATVSYEQSIKPLRMAQYFFGHEIVQFSGSQVPNREFNAVLADYFGLGTTFNSQVRFQPNVQNVIADIALYCGLNNIANGLYLKVNAPLVWSKWHMALTEDIASNGSSIPYPALYMDPSAITAPMLSVEQAFARTTPYGEITQGLLFGRIDGAHKELRVADVHALLGYNFICREHGHAGFYIDAVFPTGNRSKAVNLFEPIVGNGHHYELGLGFDGHVHLWEKDGDQTLSFYGDAEINHVFSAQERRSFDLKLPNGFGSRYILLKEFNEAGLYTGNCFPAINQTTLYCDVSCSLQLDLLLMIDYQYRDLTVDFGYEGWLRSREKISLKEGLPYNKYGLKGIQNVAFIGNLPSNATESTATIGGVPFADQALVTDSISPVYINTQNIDESSAASSRMLSHKLFAHISYAWPNCSGTYTPFLGIGSSVEFEGIRPQGVDINKPTMSFWAFWVKGGLAF